MTTLTRRAFVAGAAAIPFSVWLENHALAQAPPLKRYDARSIDGQAMLKIYAQGVDKMKKTKEGDPRSWGFQWYTHYVKDSTTKAAELKRIYPNSSAWRDLANAMWNTCQAHEDPSPPEEYFFLPWHRMYVLFFERIIRNLTGENSFTLPYWDYTALDPMIHGVIPPEFRMNGDPTFGSLYVENRNPGVNNGSPIQQNQPVDPLHLKSLEQCEYEEAEPRPGFCMGLDFNLHGAVHVLVGDSKNMAAVPWAARDPIFWLHHCNIDRLWASWNAAGPPRTNPSLSQTFVFADENGQRVVGNVADFMDIAKLAYTYDRLEKAPDCPPATSLAAGKNQRKVATVKTPPVKLAAIPVNVTLETIPEREGEVPTPFAETVKSLREGKLLYLVMKGLRAEKPPGVLYHVYLNLPSRPTSEQLKAHHVGVLSFFHAVPHGGGHQEPPRRPDKQFISSDITAVAKALQAKRLLGDKPVLTIAPAGQPALDANPIIAEIDIVEQ